LDVLVVAELVGCKQEELERVVTRWQRDVEPLFLRFGQSVLVTSREEAWYLLGGSISAEQLERFRELARLVLEEDNPALELEVDERWLANLYGKTHLLSGELRRCIVETLALMTTYPTADTPGAKVDFKGTVQWVLERALPRHANWQRWASLGQNLPTIAEAAPEFFLSRVEEDLGSADPELPKLFQDKRSSGFFGDALHCDLLWALEVLAWNPAYLSRVAVILAKLASRDPGGCYSNRPDNSLGAIFLYWLWHTTASGQERIEGISQVLGADPDVGWRLLTRLLPGATPDTSSNTHMPRWRPWADGWSRGKIQPQIAEYAIALANLTIASAGFDARRWAQVLDGMLRFSRGTNEKVFAAFEVDPILWTTGRALEDRGEPSVSFGPKGPTLEPICHGDPFTTGAGWAERSDPERSDGSRSGAQPAPVRPLGSPPAAAERASLVLGFSPS
jgi:hypothetical protein